MICTRLSIYFGRDFYTYINTGSPPDKTLWNTIQKRGSWELIPDAALSPLVRSRPAGRCACCHSPTNLSIRRIVLICMFVPFVRYHHFCV